MKKKLVIILIFSISLYSDEISSLKTDEEKAVDSLAQKDVQIVLPKEGKPLRTIGYSLIGAGIFSLILAASFNAKYDELRPWGKGIDLDTAKIEKNSSYKDYARIALYTGLFLEASSVPFLVIGYWQKNRYNIGINRRLSVKQTDFYYLALNFQF